MSVDVFPSVTFASSWRHLPLLASLYRYTHYVDIIYWPEYTYVSIKCGDFGADQLPEEDVDHNHRRLLIVLQLQHSAQFALDGTTVP